MCLGFALAVHGLLGCGGVAASANPDGSIGADSEVDGTGGEGIDSAPNDGGGSPVATLDGGCTLQASNSEGACVVDEDCIGQSGGVGGALPCVNGKCPPFCTNVPAFPTEVVNPPDGSVLCARHSGPVSPDAADVGPEHWCVPGQTCTPYDGQWGCCMSTGPTSTFCAFAYEDAGGS